MIRRNLAKQTLYLTALILSVLAASGCDSSRATVSGKVTVGGKPVTAGTVLFVGPDNQMATGTLNGEGRYEAPRVPLGTLKVAVQTLRPQQLRAAVAKRPKQAPSLPSRLTNLVAVPEKYQSPETSELTCSVQETRQDFDIVLP